MESSWTNTAQRKNAAKPCSPCVGQKDSHALLAKTAPIARLTRHKQLQCNKCNRKTSLTAQTIFHSTKLPLTKWFLAIYLMTQCKNGISQLELSRQVGVSINTAALMYHKIAQTMMERDDTKPLSGDIEADDVYWGGVKQGTRGVADQKIKRRLLQLWRRRMAGHNASN